MTCIKNSKSTLFTAPSLSLCLLLHTAPSISQRLSCATLAEFEVRQDRLPVVSVAGHSTSEPSLLTHGEGLVTSATLTSHRGRSVRVPTSFISLSWYIYI